MAKKMAAGDLSAKIDFAPGDRTSLLASMKVMQASVQALVTRRGDAFRSGRRRQSSPHAPTPANIRATSSAWSPA
ncbi:MAG: hypothetical protein IPP88_18545 [Betaproteobacteria bacterium]|nr:hypothetical protein [Betaproteobacteria bacterium]